MRVTREQLVDYTDTIFHDAHRLGCDVIRELQDAHNVNQCDECDQWLDGDIPGSDMVTVISDDEFFERYVF
jgi:hypothetical protein